MTKTAINYQLFAAAAFLVAATRALDWVMQ